MDGRTGEATAVRYGAATTTKALFKQYAEDRGASLRQLRFSHGLTAAEALARLDAALPGGSSSPCAGRTSG